MGLTLFSTTGCRRCSIVKSAMEDWSRTWEELDIKAGAREVFNGFYREHRSRIYRGEDGVEFPVLLTGDKILQGPGVILAWLKAGEPLLDFFSPSQLSGDWISGITLSVVDHNNVGLHIPELLGRLKKGGLKIEVETDGRNPSLLEILAKEALVDRLIVVLRGPAQRYQEITGASLNVDDMGKTLALIRHVPEYRLELHLSPVFSGAGRGYLPVEEAAGTAAMVEAETGSKKHPFLISAGIPVDEALAPLSTAELFRYRTACRRHMVMAEIAKP
ncbi:MAG: hypothetical protein V1793_15250 [Pseudomonadota bacterium]